MVSMGFINLATIVTRLINPIETFTSVYNLYMYLILVTFEYSCTNHLRRYNLLQYLLDYIKPLQFGSFGIYSFTYKTGLYRSSSLGRDDTLNLHPVMDYINHPFMDYSLLYSIAIKIGLYKSSMQLWNTSFTFCRYISRANTSKFGLFIIQVTVHPILDCSWLLQTSIFGMGTYLTILRRGRRGGGGCTLGFPLNQIYKSFVFNNRNNMIVLIRDAYIRLKHLDISTFNR